MSSAKNHYEILEVSPDASADEIRHAFRQAIARYHPDKVQHLGKEFQQLASDRAAELTEAYRTLMDAGKRADYDRLLALERDRQQAASTLPPPVDEPAEFAAAHEQPPAAAPRADRAPEPAPSHRFDYERASQDALIGRAALGRLKTAFVSEFGRYDEPELAGFEVTCAVRPRLFSRSSAPLFAGRFAPRADATTVTQVFTAAARAGARAPNGVCVLLLCAQIPSRSELADTIAEHRRRRTPVAVSIVPIDVRDWQAMLPPDAHSSAKALVQRLQGR